MASLDDWLDWALLVPIPGRVGSIGQSSTRLVLVALSMHADAEGYAFPSAQTLADKIQGMHRRDVRNGLDVLETSGVICRAGKVGRAVRWQLKAPEVAGDPATSSSHHPAGNLAGKLAVEMAGNPAGYPATNRTEQGQNLPPTPLARHRQIGPGHLIELLMGQDFGRDDAEAIVQRAQGDGKTLRSLSGRLKAPGEAQRIHQEIQAEKKSARRRQLLAGPKCEDHSEQPAEICTACAADIKAGQRDARYRGKHQPEGKAS